MNWIIFSFFGAIFQAMEMAIKKKALQKRGLNNVIAFIAYTFAGILLAFFYWFQSGRLFPETPLAFSFWNTIFWTVFLNVVGVWFLYKALDLADLSYLMPFMTVTSLSIVIPPMILLGEFPSALGLLGISVIVAGAFAMEYRPKNKILSREDGEKRKANRKGMLFFLGTALCYTFTPTIMKVAIEKSDVLFATYIVHLFLGAGFVVLITVAALAEKKGRKISERTSFETGNRFQSLKENLAGAGIAFYVSVLLAGVAIATQNGSVNYALSLAPVANVMAIKRMMPLFAFVIGVTYFKERNNVPQRILATLVMIAGAIIMTFS